jgi:hypothetical protein
VLGVPPDPSSGCQQQERRRADKVKATGYRRLKFDECRGRIFTSEEPEKRPISGAFGKSPKKFSPRRKYFCDGPENRFNLRVLSEKSGARFRNRTVDEPVIPPNRAIAAALTKMVNPARICRPPALICRLRRLIAGWAVPGFAGRELPSPAGFGWRGVIGSRP